MKKLSILILALVAFTGFTACTSDDDVVFIAQPDPEGISFVNTVSSAYILTNATGANTAERFVWEAVDVGVPTNITYELQGATTTEFENYTILGTTSSNNLAVTVNQLMDLAEDAGLDNDPNTEAPNTGTVYVRVVASAGTAGEIPHTSDVLSLTLILPESGDEEEDLREFYLVGNATPDNWNNNSNNTPLFRDAENPDLYYYTGKFNAGEFKLLEVKGQWQPQWGLDNGQLTSSDILGGDPGAFVVDAAGYYTLTINADEMTYSFEPYDATGATTYNAIGIVGPAQAGGWDADTDMTQLAFDPHIWYVNDIELSDGEMKFRANDAWDASWGDTTFLSGKGSNSNDPNIPVVGGVYDVWFNDLTGRYIVIPQSEE